MGLNGFMAQIIKPGNFPHQRVRLKSLYLIDLVRKELYLMVALVLGLDSMATSFMDA